jgi:hypothetical protein
MPNWCSNCISFEGTEKAMETLRKDVASIEDGHCIFTALTDYKEEWEQNDWCDEFGTKWSVTMDNDIRETMEQDGCFHCETAWSPCTEFVRKVCKKYGVEGRIEYSEGGSDFAGIVEIDVNGDEVSREDMTYREYQYEHLGTTCFFEDFINDIERGLIESEEQIREEYPYVTAEDMLELIVLFNDNVPSKN